MPSHIVIDHRIRRHFGLSLNEYVLAYIIDNLSHNTRYPWCLATRKQLAAMVEVSKRTVITMINDLEKKGFIERDENNSLRSAEKWFSAFDIAVEVTDEPDDEEGVQNLHTPETEKDSLIQNDPMQNLHTITINNKPPDSNLNVKPLTVNSNGLTANRNVDTSIRSSKKGLYPCSKLEKWQIAWDLDIPLEYVQEKHKAIGDMIESGFFQSKYKHHKTVYFTLRKWLQMDISRGNVAHLNEVERMRLENQHPDKVAELIKAAEFAKAHKIIE